MKTQQQSVRVNQDASLNTVMWIQWKGHSLLHSSFQHKIHLKKTKKKQTSLWLNSLIHLENIILQKYLCSLQQEYKENQMIPSHALIIDNQINQ